MGYLIAAGAGFALGVWRAEVWAGIKQGAGAAWKLAKRSGRALKALIGTR